jgi:hypothetical protein
VLHSGTREALRVNDNRPLPMVNFDPVSKGQELSTQACRASTVQAQLLGQDVQRDQGMVLE